MASDGAFSRQEYEAARLVAGERQQGAEIAEQALDRAAAEVEAARAAVDGTAASVGVGGSGQVDGGVAVYAPVSGEVLSVQRESGGPVAAGAQLLAIGDRSRLEAVFDVLTTQAVGIDPGDRVELVQWGGGATLPGRVQRVELSAFTKVSALGVEEQRVNVIVEPPEGESWEVLADGYRVEARVITEQMPDAATVPSTALSRRGEGWALYAVVDGRARVRQVEVGAISEGRAQILSGLGAREMVIVFPSDQVVEGTRVEP